MTTVGDVFANRYEIEREIAKGGMADVYVALRPTARTRRVAVKVLFPEFARDPSFVERFRREAQNAASLNHPNIVAVYDWGQERGTYLHRDGVRGGPVAPRHHPHRGPAPGRGGGPRSRPSSPTRSPSRTATAWCTATSSPATCSSPRAAR